VGFILIKWVELFSKNIFVFKTVFSKNIIFEKKFQNFFSKIFFQKKIFKFFSNFCEFFFKKYFSKKIQKIVFF